MTSNVVPLHIWHSRKVRLSMQILMTLDNWNLNYLPKISLLFLWFIRLFVTSQMVNVFLDFQVHVAILSIHSLLPNLFIAFFHELDRTVQEFFMCFHFNFEFFESILVLPISVRYWFYPLFILPLFLCEVLLN